MIEVKLDEKIEVTQEKYNIIMNKYDGTCFGRKEDNKFFIKLAMNKYRDLIQQIINS